LRVRGKIDKKPAIQHGLTRNGPQIGVAVRHKTDISIIAKMVQVCELKVCCAVFYCRAWF
jgi:hypothetical protein